MENTEIRHKCVRIIFQGNNSALFPLVEGRLEVDIPWAEMGLAEVACVLVGDILSFLFLHLE